MARYTKEYSESIRKAILEIYKSGDNCEEVAKLLRDKFPKLAAITVKRTAIAAGMYKPSIEREKGPAYRLDKPTPNELRIKELEEQNAQLRKDLFIQTNSTPSFAKKFTIQIDCREHLKIAHASGPYTLEYDSETGIQTIKEK